MELESTSEERNWAMVCHLAAFSGYVGVPLGWILGPLVVWLMKKDEFALVDDQGKEAINFQISLFIYYIPAIILVFFIIGIPILLALVIANIVFTIMAAVAANRGERYRYPITIRFVK